MGPMQTNPWVYGKLVIYKEDWVFGSGSWGWVK